MQYLKQKPYNFTTNTLKAYLSAQTSSFSAFVIRKTNTVQGESIVITKGPADSICLWEHQLVCARELTMAFGYWSGLGFPYAFFGTCFMEAVSARVRVNIPVSLPVCVHICELREYVQHGQICAVLVSEP